MSSSLSGYLKSYLNPKSFFRAIVLCLLILLPYIVVLTLGIELILGEEPGTIPNPLILMIGGEANFSGRILLITGLSLIGTLIATYIMMSLPTIGVTETENPETTESSTEDTVL